MAEKKLKQIIPATPGWYMIFREDDNTPATYNGTLIAGWGRYTEKSSSWGSPPDTYVLPLCPEYDTGDLIDWTDCSNFEGVVFRPEWFRQSPTAAVQITHFDPIKVTTVTD